MTRDLAPALQALSPSWELGWSWCGKYPTIRAVLNTSRKSYSPMWVNSFLTYTQQTRAVADGSRCLLIWGIPRLPTGLLELSFSPHPAGITEIEVGTLFSGDR